VKKEMLQLATQVQDTLDIIKGMQQTISLMIDQDKLLMEMIRDIISADDLRDAEIADNARALTIMRERLQHKGVL